MWNVPDTNCEEDNIIILKKIVGNEKESCFIAFLRITIVESDGGISGGSSFSVGGSRSRLVPSTAIIFVRLTAVAVLETLAIWYLGSIEADRILLTFYILVAKSMTTVVKTFKCTKVFKKMLWKQTLG